MAKAEQSAMQTPDHQDCQNTSQVVAGLSAISGGLVTAFLTWLRMKFRPPADPRIQRMERELEQLRTERSEAHILENFKRWFRDEGLKELRAEFGRRR